MSAPKQVAADRLNTQKSKRLLGHPRSAEAEAASRANPLKTGLSVRSYVTAGKDSLRWQTATLEESFLVATLIDAAWPLRRSLLIVGRRVSENGTGFFRKYVARNCLN